MVNALHLCLGFKVTTPRVPLIIPFKSTEQCRVSFDTFVPTVDGSAVILEVAFVYYLAIGRRFEEGSVIVRRHVTNILLVKLHSYALVVVLEGDESLQSQCVSSW